MMKMTRRVMFSAAIQEEGSDQDARNIYGHNYFLEVTVEGEINPATGIILNIKELDEIVKKTVVSRLDKKLLNRVFDEFNQTPPTSENLAVRIANELKAALPKETRLSGVRLEETPLDAVEWRPRSKATNEKGLMNQMQIQVTRSYEFAASHRLHSPHLSDEENIALFGKCNYANGHGHNYILEVTVSGPINPIDGRVIPPDELDSLVNREVADRYDHRHLNLDIPEFEGLITSTEVLTKMIWDRLKPVIPAPVRLYKVLVRETARNIFEYSGENETL